MARYTGPKCRLCRRLGVKLYLKGSRCEGEKCAMVQRSQAPGQHGNSYHARRRRGSSDYKTQLVEKQKAKRIYGVLERQFRRYVKSSLRSKGVAGEVLMQKLETRLDNLVYRSGFARSRAQARQLIRSGVFIVDDSVETIPSRNLKIGSVVKPVSFDKISLREGFVLADWLKANVKEKCVKLARLPTLDDVSESFDVQLIIEFYSR
jgi:small subunit ribosomal protein S4